MKHLLKFANGVRNYDVSVNTWNNYAKETIRVVDGLIDIGNRHRQIGKTTAILELARDFADSPLNKDHIIVVICANRFAAVNLSNKPENSGIIFAHNNDDLQYKIRGKYPVTQKLILFADEAPLKDLPSCWHSGIVVFKAGWLSDVDKV